MMRRLIILFGILLLTAAPVSSQGAYWARYDVNSDYGINVQDIMLVASHWGAEIEPPPESEVYVVSSAVYVQGPPADTCDVLDLEGATFFVGEIYNGSDSPIDYEPFWALYDEYGRLVFAEQGYTGLEAVPPGMRSAFSYWSSLGGYWNLAKEWTSYQVGVAWSFYVSPTPVQLIETIEESTYWDECAYFHVNGQFVNSLDEPISSVEFYLTLYDLAGEVIGTGGHSTQFGINVEPGEVEPFDARIRYWRGRPDTSRVGDYALVIRARPDTD